jgi:RNA recognition motif-containing protein
MNKKLHVGNLSYDTTEDQLQQLFADVGPVLSVAIITDRSSGRSKGFGFVEMETEQAAKEAIERLNNYELSERTIAVSEARPPRERSSGGGGGRGRSSRGGGGGRRRY